MRGATLRVITATAVGAVPGPVGCTITYVTGRRTVEPAGVDRRTARRVDDAQGRLQEGPA